MTSSKENASSVGKALCKSTKVAAMSFTGSTKVGKYDITQKDISYFRLKYNFKPYLFYSCNICFLD